MFHFQTEKTEMNFLPGSKEYILYADSVKVRISSSKGHFPIQYMNVPSSLHHLNYGTIFPTIWKTAPH